MADEPKSSNWWKTLPGVLTAITGFITAVASLLAVLHTIGLLDPSEWKSKIITPPTIATEETGAKPDQNATKTTEHQVLSSSQLVNLLAPDNGGHAVLVSGDQWLGTIDGKEDFNQIDYGLGAQNQAVFAFKDEKTATIEMFKVLIGGTSDNNIKEFELFAGRTSPTGPFELIDKFETKNFKIIKSPYQEFRFSPVTAKYLKIKLLSTYGGSEPNVDHPNLEEIQVFGRLIE